MRAIIGCIVIALLSTANAFAAVSDTLYINRDTVTYGSFNTHICAFNGSSAFSASNKVLQAEVGESISTTVINNDSLPHTFFIDGYVFTNNEIAAGDTLTFSYAINSEGSYIYYSDKAYGNYLGGAGHILIGFQDKVRFFWNLYEQQSSLSVDLASLTTTVLPNNFFADVYTINGRIYPDVANDTTAIVTGMVGDSIVISVVNTGKMAHSLHFHGYHIKILTDSQHPQKVGWSKDTYPIEPHETCTFLLVPHQPGMYPVHDHNLFAVNTGGYPGGMITRIMIMP